MSRAPWLGTATDWGLTELRFVSVADELNDHVSCIAEGQGVGEAPGESEAVQAGLSTPATRRRITSAHVPDQVVATLNRRPSREEWRELLWLLGWFALILLGDWLAALSTSQLQDLHAAKQPSTGVVPWAAWLLQAAGRAGFFAALALNLMRAWRGGWGVLIARLLQLKLIHTVLVLSAGVFMGPLIQGLQSSVLEYVQIERTGMYLPAAMVNSTLPAWFNVVLICTALAAAAGILLLRQMWPYALGCALTAVFLFPGGPLRTQEYTITQPIFYGELVEWSDGYLTRGREPRRGRLISAEEPQVIARYRQDPGGREGVQQLTAKQVNEYVTQHSWNIRPQTVIDAEHNLRTDTLMLCQALGGSLLGSSRQNAVRPDPQLETKGPARLSAPITIAGAGLGWLSLPIPVFGVVGLLALLGLMARRGAVELALYSTLVIVALGTTLMPLFAGYESSLPVVDLGISGVIGSPLPGFDSLILAALLYLSEDPLTLTIILGLLLSAGIPWLLTSLFLKTGTADVAGGSNPLEVAS